MLSHIITYFVKFRRAIRILSYIIIFWHILHILIYLLKFVLVILSSFLHHFMYCHVVICFCHIILRNSFPFCYIFSYFILYFLYLEHICSKFIYFVMLSHIIAYFVICHRAIRILSYIIIFWHILAYFAYFVYFDIFTQISSCYFVKFSSSFYI